MRLALLLKTAAVWVALFALGHCLGYPWMGSPSAQQRTQLEAAISLRFVTQGFVRSYGDFHTAFGWSIGLAFLVQAILFWRLANLSRDEPRTARFVAVLFAVLHLTLLLVYVFYLFWAPIVFSALIAVTLLGAALSPKERAGAAGQMGECEPVPNGTPPRRD